MRKKSKGRVRKFDEENNIVEFKKKEKEAIEKLSSLEGYETFDPSNSFDVEDFINEGLEQLKDPQEEDVQEDQEEEYRSKTMDAAKEDDDYDAIKLKRSAETPRKNKKRRNRRLVYIGVIVLILGIIAYSVHNIVALKIEERHLLAQQQQLEEQKEELKKELTRVNDKEYIEQQAREQLNMIKPGEILYQLPGDGDEDNGN